MSKNINPVVRIAPSPTGNLHVGTARSALFNFLFARQNNGKFILRIEDTDRERSTLEFEKNVLEGMGWLGLSYDEIYRQSERTNVYTGELNKLLKKGVIYLSQEKEPGKREEVFRFKNPNKQITFQDEIRGQVSFDTTELGDFVIAKSVTEPLYNFAVVVDDFLSGITHVIRGEDHLSNTPRQILIQEAMGAPRPIYAHLPLLLGKDRSKLSKRHGATSISDYKDRGFLPEAMVNFLALLGFNPGGDLEIFSLDELIKIFDLKRVQKGGAVFDEEKLKWMNKEHLKLKGEEFLNEYLAQAILSTNRAADLKINLEAARKAAKLFAERISVASELKNELEAGEWDYLFIETIFGSELLIWKKDTGEKTLSDFDLIISAIEKVDFHASKESIQTALNKEAEKIGSGSFFWPLRVAMCGKDMSPDPISLMLYFGKEETLVRLNNAKHALQK
ncbi:MAG TPA: glutamate--tRNA ligase [Candidatus Paceibacterota bacterium]